MQSQLLTGPTSSWGPTSATLCVSYYALPCSTCPTTLSFFRLFKHIKPPSPPTCAQLACTFCSSACTVLPNLPQLTSAQLRSQLRVTPRGSFPAPVQVLSASSRSCFLPAAQTLYMQIHCSRGWKISEASQVEKVQDGHRVIFHRDGLSEGQWKALEK